MKEKISRIFDSVKDFVTDPKNRRYVIGGAVILAALIVILCASLGKSKVDNTDADCRYPYTLAANDRAATVTISGPFAEGAVWSVENSAPDVITVTERRQNQKKAVFDIKAAAQGNAHTAFRLKDPSSDYTFDIYIDLFVDPEKSINIIGSSHFDRTPDFMPVPVSGSDAEYAITYDDSEAMHVIIRSENAPQWAAESLNPEIFDAYRVTQFPVSGGDAPKAAVSGSDAQSAPVSGSDPTPVEYIDTGLVEFEMYGYDDGAGILRFANSASGVEFDLYIYVDAAHTVFCITEQEFNELEAERLLEQAEAEAAGEPDYYSSDYFDDLNDQFIQSLIEQQAAEQNGASPSEEQPVDEQPAEEQPVDEQPADELPDDEQPVVA